MNLLQEILKTLSLPEFYFAMFRSATPVLLTTLGAMISSRSGTSNIALEGTMLISALTCQIISNVPAAMLLSGYTKEIPELIVGTNLGGLGTLIASMASLISYRQITAADASCRKRYILIFTVFNLVFLAILYQIR